MDIYFIICVITQYYFACFIRLFLLWPLELLQAASVSLSYALLLFVCVVLLLSSFLLFGIILYFPCSSPEISLFSKELLFLLLANGI